MKLFQVVLVIGHLFKHDSAYILCPSDCKVLNWESWSVCSGICGSQSQKRVRHMCCDDNVKPQTLKNCLEHCNFTANFQLTLSMPCVEFVKMVEVLVRRRCYVNVIYIMKVVAVKVRNVNSASYAYVFL